MAITIGNLEKKSVNGKVWERGGTWGHSVTGVMHLVEVMNSMSRLGGASKSDLIIPKLVAYIKESNYKPGDRLPPEEELSEILGVGARAMREALLTLRTLGLLQSRQGAGWYLLKFNPTSSVTVLTPLLQYFAEVDVLQIFQARLLMEPQIAALTAENITDEGLDRLQENLKAMEIWVNEGNLEGCRREDRHFHDTLTEECGNVVLTMQNSILTGMFYSSLWKLPAQNQPNVISQHNKIFQAIRARDSQQASDEMRSHIQHALDYITTHFGNSRSISSPHSMGT